MWLCSSTCVNCEGEYILQLREKIMGINFHRWMMTWGMVFGSTFWLILWNINNDFAQLLVGEDHVIESAQFVFLFLGAIYFTLLARMETGFLRYFFLLAMLSAFFLAMEEISWGQRIFDITTPKGLEEINVQGEINFHNLEFFQGYRHWYLGGVVSLGLLATYVSASFFQLIKPDNILRYAFFLTLLTSIVMEFANFQFGLIEQGQARQIRFFAGRFSEIGELAFSMAVFSYAWCKYYWPRENIVVKCLIPSSPKLY